MNPFVVKMATRLKDKGLAESSINLYISRLKILNNGRFPTSLAFLRHYLLIMSRIKPYAFNTQKGFVSTIVSVLDFVKHSPAYKKAYNYYSQWLENATEETLNKMAESGNEMTEREKKEWIPWSDVLRIRKTIREIVAGFCNRPKLEKHQYEELLKYVILCLYTCFPPERNQNYQLCYIVPEITDDLPKDRNYLSLLEQKFVFNVYKTAKTYGTEGFSFLADTEDNDTFREALKCYLKYHPLMKGKKGRNFSVPLLVDYGGSPFLQPNAITRRLNASFSGKKIGASMLRHIYLTGKYGGTLASMKEDSKAMGHSLNTQRAYIRNETSPMGNDRYVVDEEDAKAVEDALREIESS
jgi:hypothetical protein